MRQTNETTSSTLRAVAAWTLLAALLAAPAAAAKKPPPPQAPPDPQVTFVDGSKLYVCDADGGNKVLVHQDRDRYLRSPRMAPDRRNVLFVAGTFGTAHEVRRVHFDVANGALQIGATEVVVAVPDLLWEIALSPLGDRFVFAVDSTLYELEICAEPPCDPATATALYTPPPERFVQPIGGYSANGLAYFFEESGTTEDFDPAFLRLDLTTGAVDRVLTVPSEPGDFGIATWLQPGPIDRGGLDSRLLFDAHDALYVFDTRTGELSGPLGEGHHATWSPDESHAISVRSFRYTNSVYGPLLLVDLATGQATQLVKSGGEPDWR